MTPAAMPKTDISTPQPDATIITQCHSELLERRAVMYHQLADLLAPLVKALVLLPEAVEIEVREKDNTISFSLSVDPSDRGRIIGKQGKILQALRLLFQSIATIQDRNADVQLNESD